MRRFRGMVFGTTTAKITITLKDDQVEEIRALVAAGRAANVSAFVQHAVGGALFDAAGWREMLEDALQQTGGALTKKERDWAGTILSLPANRTKEPGKGRPRERYYFRRRRADRLGPERMPVANAHRARKRAWDAHYDSGDGAGPGHS